MEKKRIFSLKPLLAPNTLAVTATQNQKKSKLKIKNNENKSE
ncbi:T-box-containing protein [Flavobacterium sp. N2469]|nr:T-box-containing protein [Flavobacterium sp. N2469]